MRFEIQTTAGAFNDISESAWRTVGRATTILGAARHTWSAYQYTHPEGPLSRTGEYRLLLDGRVIELLVHELSLAGYAQAIEEECVDSAFLAIGEPV